MLISGDMLLSTISTNVSVWPIDPEGDPLRLFLDSIARYRELPKDVLVLPSHGKPFRGAHARVEQLEKHHQDRLAELLESLNAPQSAAELLERAVSPAARHTPDFLRDGRGDRPPALSLLRRARHACPGR